MIVDAWCQHPTQQFLADPMFATLRRWVGSDGMPPELPPDLTAQAMEAISGVGLLSAWHGPQGALIPNDAVAASVAAAPDRLVGIASVDLRRPMDAVRELRRCVKTLGFRGLRMLPWLWEVPPDDRRYYPLYAECIELDVPFCTQVGHAGPLRPSEPGRPMPYLDVVACEFPELRIVAGHVGVPWLGEMLSLLSASSLHRDSLCPCRVEQFEAAVSQSAVPCRGIRGNSISVSSTLSSNSIQMSISHQP